MINDNLEDDAFLKQSNWILNIGVKSELCPFSFSCDDCVVYYYRKNEDLCSKEKRKQVAKHYIRNEKLKRIQNDK